MPAYSPASCLRNLLLVCCQNVLLLSVLLPGSLQAADGREETLRVALLLETPLGDHDWNDALAEGLERAGQQLKVHTSVVVAPHGQNMASLETLFRDTALVNDLLIVASDNLHEILRNNAADFRKTMFGCIDASIRAPNIMSVTYADEQAAYLAGAAAAMLAVQKDMLGVRGNKILGWISGEDIPAMRNLLEGFTEGARIIDPEIRVIHAVTGSFGDAAAGRREAHRLLAEGADVLALACGMGNDPALKEVQAHHAYAVGVNVDKDNQLPGQILTSIIKHPDTAVYEIVAAATSGHFQGKEVRVRDLRNGGVDITDMQVFRTAVGGHMPKNMDRRLRELRGEILRGGVRLKSLRARTLCDCR